MSVWSSRLKQIVIAEELHGGLCEDAERGEDDCRFSRPADHTCSTAQEDWYAGIR